MPRLGELLVAAGMLETEKLEQALRAQVVWGGRLGTNLIELGFIDLDELSRVLGRQHGLPAALARHFDKADPELQKQLPPELADRYSFVPLLGLADDKIALAAMDPLRSRALVEIGGALRCAPENLVLSVAAEQRMRYQLERVYGIARAARYKRARGGTIPPFPQFGDFSTEADSEVEIDVEAPVGDDELDIPIEWEDQPSVPTVQTPRTNTDAMAALIEDAVAHQPAQEPSGRDKRTYVTTLADAEAPPAKEQKALGRIAIRKVAVGATPPQGVTSEDATLADAARAIRRATHRERVASLVVAALDKFAPNCQAAALLVVRGDTATGWKSFSRANTAIPEVAVPLDEAGLVPTAVERAATMRGKHSALGEIDRRLLAALAKPSGELAIVPIAITGKVVCVIAIATEPDAPIPNVETIATAAGTAFARLLRDAGR